MILKEESEGTTNYHDVNDVNEEKEATGRASNKIKFKSTL